MVVQIEGCGGGSYKYLILNYFVGRLLDVYIWEKEKRIGWFLGFLFELKG